MRVRANIALAMSMLVILVVLVFASPGGAFSLDGNAAKLAKIALILVIAFVWMNVPFLLAYAIAGRLLGAHVKQISIGVGPNAISVELGHLKITMAPFVFGGFVQYHGKGLGQLPPMSQMLIALSGPIGAIAANAFILREETLAAAARTWSQIYTIATNFSRSWDVIPSILTAEHERGLVFVVALIATKAAAANLLPIPVLAGGNALMHLFETSRGRPLNAAEQHNVLSAGLVACLALALLICGRFAYEAYNYAIN